MDAFEVLVVERDEFYNATYYIRWYIDGMETKGIDLKLSDEQFYNFTENKREV